MTALVLQARLDSSRLPRKALLPLGSKPLVQAVMTALKTVPAQIHVLACPRDSVDAFAPLAEAEGFYLYGGPKEDVLKRYCDVIRRYKIERLIRATGDNPFVFADAAWTLHLETLKAGSAYGGYQDLPYGAGVEAVDAQALLRAEAQASLPGEREHVCPYLYTHPEIFPLYRPPAPAEFRFPHLRISVDTGEDYERALLLEEALTGRYGSDPRRFSGKAVLEAAGDAGLLKAPGAEA
jgi:spore coat polysaccharide biosynthesis protein SpsF